MAGQPNDMMQILAHHDAAIGGLSSRIGHVEKTLVDHGTVLHRIETAVTKQDAKPQFDFHKTVGTVVALAVLFSMICGGIIWITTGQFGAMIAEQKSFNGIVKDRLDRHDTALDKITEAIGAWRTNTTVREPRK